MLVVVLGEPVSDHVYDDLVEIVVFYLALAQPTPLLHADHARNDAISGGDQIFLTSS